MGYEYIRAKKETFKLFDFFAVCEYFEEKYNYDQVLKLPNPREQSAEPTYVEPKPKKDGFDYKDNDYITNMQETLIGNEGMKVDRMFFKQFEDTVKQDSDILKAIEAGNIDTAMGLTLDKYLNKPQEFFTVDKLRKALKLDRKVTLREILEQIFYGNTIKGKEELMTDEFEKFISTVPENEITDVEALKYYFYAYLTDPNLRKIIDTHDYTELNYNPTFGVNEFTRVDEKMREKIPYYIKTYIPLDKFLSA
jgi:type I restriction enzyme R subunit